MKKILSILVLFILFPIMGWSYPWPVSPFTGPHPITGTLGEFRTPTTILDNHFHSGVDIGRGAGTNVYPSFSGYIPRQSGMSDKSTENGWVQVGRGRYVHINVDDNLMPGQHCEVSVTLLGVIGNVASFSPHLHFEEYSGGTKLNPLASLDNYEDNAVPTVWKPDFWHQSYDASGSARNNSIPKNGLWGKIDIRARAKDAQSNGSDTVGMYKMGYAVQDEEGNILLYEESIEFEKIVGRIERGLQYVYDIARSNKSRYFYWLTNRFVYATNNAEDRYWNTKLKKGQVWNGADARVNAEAEYPDGRYIVWAFGKDIKGNGGDFSNLIGADTSVIVLDNFVPYVESVMVKGVVMVTPSIIHESSYIQKSSKEDDGKLCLNQKRKIRRRK